MKPALSNSDSEIVLTRAQAREADRIAIEEYGIPGIVLMENAGRSAAEIIKSVAREKRRAEIYCGPGNNGGDGYVIARHLANAGFDVRVVLTCDRERVAGDAAVSLRIIEKMGMGIIEARRHEGTEARRGANVIVDALLGTGSVGDPRGAIADAIKLINDSKGAEDSPIVFAIDIPSGLDADTGAVGNPAIRADHTITFMAAKRGFMADSAKPFIGQVHVADIGIPRKILQSLS